MFEPDAAGVVELGAQSPRQCLGRTDVPAPIDDRKGVLAG
jgi:hypothetical protein